MENSNESMNVSAEESMVSENSEAIVNAAETVSAANVAGNDDARKMKKAYSKYGLAVAIFGVGITILETITATVFNRVTGQQPADSGWFAFANTIVCIYMIGFPILFLATKNMEKKVPEKHKLGFGKFIVCIMLMAGMIGVGAVVGILLNYALTLPFGVSAQNSSELAIVMMNSHPFWRILTAGILAPIFEELIFRKFLIDRTYRYGEWVAIFTSGLMFGLFHGNFAQFFFTTLIGGLFAYIYIRTGRIWYTMGLHAVLNLSTSVITMATMKPYMEMDPNTLVEYQNVSNQYLATQDPALAQRLTELASEVLPKMMPFVLWSGLAGQVILVGIVLWIIFLAKKKFTLKRSENFVEKGGRFAWGNVGMILFLVYSIASIALNYIQLIVAYGGK